MKMNKVCSNLDQSSSATGGFTDEEKQTMRNNIGAASDASVSRLSSKVTRIESIIAPKVATATVKYDNMSVPLIGDMKYLKVYCIITATAGCQIKVMPADSKLKIGAFRAITYSAKRSLDMLRQSLPFDAPLTEDYSGYIFYEDDNFGTIDIDVLLTDETTVHLTVWYKVDVANTAYRLYLVEEART